MVGGLLVKARALGLTMSAWMMVAAPGGPVASAGIPPSTVAPSPGSPEWDAIRFRTTFGLPADLDFVRATLSDVANYSSEAYGVPLADDEVTELLRRASIEDALPLAIDIAREAGGFAGVYLDQPRGGRPIFMTTRPTEELRVALASALPVGANVELVAATRTEADLAKLKESIEADRPSWLSSGVHIVRVGIRPSLNTVRIGVLTSDESAAPSIHARYGDDVVVHETQIAHADACVAANNCRPMKGGIAINPTGGPAAVCTSGFVVRRTDTSALAMLTAGHCIQKWGGFDQAWQHNADGFGRALYETFEVGGSGWADVGLINDPVS